MIWYDYYYLILVVPALIISGIAQWKVKSTYSKMSQMKNKRGISGAEAAARVLSYYGITNVSIHQTQGKLSDHYDPRGNIIRLSPEVYHGRSIASVGIACHEAGHAAQHAQNYVPINVRNLILPVANIGSSFGFIIAILGYFLGFGMLIDIGIILFASVTVFQLVTLPIEFNASRRALTVIEETGMLEEIENARAKQVLTAAAMTYVAALLVSIMSLLRLILKTRNRRN